MHYVRFRKKLFLYGEALSALTTSESGGSPLFGCPRVHIQCNRCHSYICSAHATQTT